jgi:hypothetical protein
MAPVFAGTCLTVVFATCAWLEISTGSFLTNVVAANVNPFSWSALASNLAVFVIFMGGPSIVAILYILDRARPRRAEDELLITAWMVSLWSIIGLAKVGSGQNYWIEYAATTTVLATSAIWFRCRHHGAPDMPRRAGIPVALVGVTVAIYSIVVSLAASSWFSELWPDPLKVQALSSVVQRVRSEPGAVLANPADVVVLAGRPLAFEPYIFSILHSEGRWDTGALVGRIRAGDIGLLVLDRPLETADASLHGYARWPAPVLDALREVMVLERAEGERLIYAPRRPPRAASQPTR